MPDNALTKEPGDRSILEVFEEFIRTREFEQPPPAHAFAQQLPDDGSRGSFIELVDSYAWTQDLLPRNVQPNVVLAGRFRLIERLGAGGMGQVWRAEDQKLGRHVAVKVMSLLGTGTLDSEAAFERETQLLARLRHPGIVSVLDSDRDEEHRFLVMDLVEGRSLEQVLDSLIGELRSREDGTSPPSKALRGSDLLNAVDTKIDEGHDSLISGDESYGDAVVKVMIEVLKTLEAAHSRLVVHRDLKPGNLMMTAGGQPVLLDFGLGGTIGGAPGDLTSSLFGTFRFVAPEQLSRGRAGTDVRTDIYQLGIVLYEFLTLKKCFGSEDHSELFARIVKGQFAMPRSFDGGIPRDLEDVCLRAIDVNPAHRYQTASEFRDALERYLRREPVHPDSLGSVQRVVRQTRYAVRRHKPLVVGIAAVALVGVLAWFSGFLSARPVFAAPINVALDNQLQFSLEVRSEQWVTAVLQRLDPDSGKTNYRPVSLLPTPDEGDGTEPKEMVVVLPDRTYQFRTAIEEGLDLLDGQLSLTCQLAATPGRMGKLLGAIQKMRTWMRENESQWVDEQWMRDNWNIPMRGPEDNGPFVPKSEFFRGEGWERGQGARTVRGFTIKWPLREPKSKKPD